MPLELYRLKIQLENLKVLLQDAAMTNKPFIEQAKISKQMVEIEHLIEKRKEFLKSQEGKN